MSHTVFRLAAAVALATALPVAAQSTPPAPAAAAAPRGPGGPRDGYRPQMFKSMTPAGQQIMRDAMMPGDPKADRAGIDAARDQVMTLLDADKLDSAALKRAMDAERAAADAMHTKRQAAMLAAFQKLSVADRKAFVADARKMRDRMESRAGKHGGWGHRGPGGPGGPGMDDGMMPPPPPQQ
jgi:Spy/CpxP family protein refolding chaperone